MQYSPDPGKIFVSRKILNHRPRLVSARSWPPRSILGHNRRLQTALIAPTRFVCVHNNKHFEEFSEAAQVKYL